MVHGSRQHRNCLSPAKLRKMEIQSMNKFLLTSPKPPELQKHAKHTNRYADSVKKSCKIAANPTSQILIATKLNEHISTAEFLSFPLALPGSM